MKTKHKQGDEPLQEYDFRAGRRGRYAQRFAAGTNLVMLEPDIANVFRSSDAVNGALRKLLPKAPSRASVGGAIVLPPSTPATKAQSASAAFYVERRSAGEYIVRFGGAAEPSAIASTQLEAIQRARRLSPDVPIHVERVRQTNSGSRDKWRKP